MQGGFWAALIMSTLAGLSTAVGSLIALFAKRTDTKLLSFALGFSAGVMLTVSLLELLPESKENLASAFGQRNGGLAATLSMLLGLGIAILIDCLVPPFGDASAEHKPPRGRAPDLMRMGLVTALALTLHNFPEGIATFMAGYSDLRLGLPITLSIAMHNIPEGIAVSVPVYFGTGSRGKAFGISALSGLSEPLGALAAYFILAPFLSSATLGVIFGAVAGIMIYLSLDELIPQSQRCGYKRIPLFGVISGGAVMWAALSFFRF